MSFEFDLSKEQEKRYARHIAMPEIGRVGQKKLLSSKVMILGAGGLASPAALYLAAAGVGTIGIADADIVEESNLQRQIIHAADTVGMKKVRSAQQRIEKLNPEVRVKAYDEFVTKENISEIIRDYDFVIDAVDGYETKYLINDACTALKKPFSYAGVVQFGGQTMTVIPGKSPCVRCVFEDVPKPGTVPTAKEVGVAGAAVGVIGSVQALEAVKYITGAGELLIGRLLTFDGLSMEFRTVNLPGINPECPACKTAR